MTAGAPLTWRFCLLCVAAFAAFTAFAGLFALPPLDRDEARFAQATAQMIESGDYVAIRFQGRERNKKPAGVYWLQAASVKAFSNVEAREIWAYRIPSMIGVVIAAIFTFLAGARAFDARTGLLAGLLLASAPVVAAEATIAKTDGVLLGLVAMAQYAFLTIFGAVQEGRKPGWPAALLFWTAQGAAALVKGPIAPMISLVTGLGVAGGKWRFNWLAAMRPVSGFLLFILMVLPWGLAIWQATDGRFFTQAVGGDMLGKIGDAQEGHNGPPGYHTLLIWPLFWPAAALILPGLLQSWRARTDWRQCFLLAWAIPAWIVFEIAATKLPHYVMPLYPALAIMAARAAVSGVPDGWVRKASALLYAGVGLAAAALIALPPLAFSGAGPAALYFAAAAITAIAALLIAVLFWRGRAVKGAVAASLLASLYAWTLLGAVLPGLTQLTIAPRLSAALELADRHPIHDGRAPVAITGYAEPSAVFLLGTQTALTDPQDAARRLLSGAASAAVVEAREDAAFKAALDGAPVTALAVIDGLNYSNGDQATLTIYALAPAKMSGDS
ncbi:ArnT family glycosyltransferase [Hyphococcus luteus]|uniref:Glycosyltransferase RgtA/B/C/D-like domain-containing protein n=1 Tax=Hyphococcus luteus TaxID=2058213 RepID=A0A2S7K7J9_9PROT|nr:glycosyltransferase family 39 protein [Marinicaulis flavus]PQA88461.1 hypothetical protein CW354_09230 [Marinicaulis flavus]